MAVLKNRAKMSTSTTGTGTITLGSAESGYQTFADAGVANGNVVRYVIEDGSNFEIGTGTYTATGTTLTRTVSESSNSDAAINLSGSATVFIGATAEDIPALYAENYDGTSTLPSATGTNAVALQDSAVASGNRGFAAGRGAVASGTYSVALGTYTDAVNFYGTAIGYNAQAASGDGATALTNSRASGAYSFAAAIGNNTSTYGATGSNSVAIGQQAKSTGLGSVAIGYGNPLAQGNVSFATQRGQATGGGSIAMGHFNTYGFPTASGLSAIVIGDGNTGSATRSVVLGNDSTSSHTDAIVIGGGASSSAADQITLGHTDQTVRISSSYTLPTADGTNGQVLTTNGSGAVTFADAGGGASEYTIDNKTAAYTVVSGDLGKVLNYTSGTVDVTLTALSSLSTGFHVSIWNSGTGVISIKPNSADGIGVSAGNDYDSSDPLKLEMGTGVTLVNSGTYWQIYSEKAYDYYHHSVTLGANAKASNNYAMALGNRSSASSVGAIAIGTGQGHATTASNSHAVAIGLSTASGANSVALGTSYASGSHSLAAAITNNTSSYGATGANSIAIGDRAKATSSNTLAAGSLTTSSGGDGSTALGYISSATGLASFTAGTFCTASGKWSQAIGYDATTQSISGKLAKANGDFSAAGDAQYGLLVLRQATTDATPKTLISEVTPFVTTGNTTNQVILPNNSAYSFSGTIIAREDATDGSDYASWEIKGALLRDANAASTVLGNGIQNKLYATSGASAWAIALSADTTNGGLKIEVTGAASTNIRWVATVNTSEVTYA
jgi:hypothetical protein